MKVSAAERKRLNLLLRFEREAQQQGYKCVVGVDEAGRGPMAGPVVAAACHIPDGVFIPGINDSKQLTAESREEIYSKLSAHPDVSYSVGIIDHQIIDEINILQASIKAMIEAVDAIKVTVDYLLVDGLKLPHPVHPSLKIIKGDSLSYSIAAASIVAKVTRDRIMKEYHELYPEYGFDQHKGYGTAKHREALEKYGPSPIHRRSFSFKS